MSSVPKLSIVFLNYNRLHETRYTLEHLHQLLAARPQADIEVIAVDNNSHDGTGAYLETQHDWMQPILLDSNTGIAGYNHGFKQAKGEYILVLDDDSHPVDNRCLDRLIERLDNNPEIGAIACRIEDTQGNITHSWHLPQSEQPCPSLAFVGCGFAIRRELFAKVGWYPEEFFLYQNEIEVAIRVLCEQAQIYYDPECHVVHRQSPIGRGNWRRVYYPTRNTIWIIRRYCPFPIAAYFIASRLFFGLIRAVQTREWRWYFQAVKESFTAPIQRHILPPALRKRLRVFWQQNSVFHHFIEHL